MKWSTGVGVDEGFRETMFVSKVCPRVGDEGLIENSIHSIRYLMCPHMWTLGKWPVGISVARGTPCYENEALPS